MFKNQVLAIQTFQSKWRMASQEAHASTARTCSHSEDFAWAEMSAVQGFEDTLQRQYDGQLRSRVHAIQDECRDHIEKEEDKLHQALQQALTQESSVRRDQLQQALRRHACQEEHADELSTRER